MADVYIVVFSVIGILISYPGLVAALNLLLPRATEAAYLRLAYTPGKALLIGLPVAGLFSLFIIVTANINFGPVKALAFIAALIAFGINAVGGAALARLMGERIDAITQSGTSLRNLVLGAIFLELASLFPIIGWFLFLPISMVITIGAASFGLIGWAPKIKHASAPAEVATFTAVETHS
jgi:hypothetical protein